MEQVSLVEFCADGRLLGPRGRPGACSVRPRQPGCRAGTVPRHPAGRHGPAGPVRTPLPVRPAYSPFTAARVDDRTWQVSLMMRSPKAVTITAYAADGSVLAQREVEPGWTRVGGSEACGGPETAGPVRLVI